MRPALAVLPFLGTGAVALAAGASWPFAVVAAIGAVGWCLAWSHRPAPVRPAPIAESPPAGPWQADALTEALAAIVEGVVVLDRDHCVIAANAAACEMLGLLEPPPTPRPISELVDWPQLIAALASSRRHHAPSQFEADRGDAAAPRPVAVEIAVRGPRGLSVVVLRDLSRLRRLESLRRDFVANVSHELKTPLAAIQGFVETLLDDPDVPAPTRLRFLQRVQLQVERLSTLVADLLTLSRLDEGPAEPADPCDLAMVVREVVRDLLPLADKRAVALRAEVPDAAVWIAAEREALRQVVSNLADNAIKYTPGGGSVTVRLLPGPLRAELAVADTGIGLSPADQARVFERFYRVDKARSREVGGTGLGLSIVKNTVASLGGEVAVQSELGRGSTFTVRLPCLPSQPEADQPSD